MKFTLSWLKKFLDVNTTVTEIGETLTFLGLEVENIIDRREELANFEIAHIVSTKPHPNANNLQICLVQTKNDGILQIVCGAPNARQDLKVVLAKIGTIIPDGGFKIKESLIRGEQSFGMLCSASELLINSDSDGIIELPSDAIIGEKIINYYGLDDPVFEINVTPNRADALSVYGIARDLAAKGLGILKIVQTPKIVKNLQSSISLNVETSTSETMFLLREIRNIKNIQSPVWLSQLLTNIGVKSISSIVDIGNYVMYSFGQPMHAYDSDKLQDNNIFVRLLEIGEKFIALNDREYILANGDMVIASSNKVECLAGIIGGKNSACDENTVNIILEAAHFDPAYIKKTGRRLSVDSDSRYRFERGIDSNFTEKALNLATDMILSICGGDASDIVSSGPHSTALKKIEFDCDSLLKLTGIELEISDIIKILSSLGFNLKSQNSKILTLEIPSWRGDISMEEDVIEEIARVYGYDKIISSPLLCTKTDFVSQDYKRSFDVKSILARRNYDELVTYSFMDSDSAKLFVPFNSNMQILNPITIEYDYMRPSILPNLLKIVKKNTLRSIENMSLFELGPIFSSCDLSGETNSVTGVRCGLYNPKDIHTNARYVDVFDIKADIEQILAYCNLPIDKCQFSSSDLPPYYHPSRSSAIKLGKSLIAYIGQIHPLLLKHYDIDMEVVAFELNIDNIPFPKQKFGKREEFIISNFQAISRDYAMIISKEQAVGEILSYIKNINKSLIQSVELFDIYNGDKLPIDKKSICFRLKLQHKDRTLTEEDINMFTNDMIDKLSSKFGAKLRDN